MFLQTKRIHNKTIIFQKDYMDAIDIGTGWGKTSVGEYKDGSVNSGTGWFNTSIEECEGGHGEAARYR